MLVGYSKLNDYWIITIYDETNHRFRVYKRSEGEDESLSDLVDKAKHDFNMEFQSSRDSNEVNLILTVLELQKHINDISKELTHLKSPRKK